MVMSGAGGHGGARASSVFQSGKTPLDLWLYQELLHDVRPDVLIEAGTKFGGGAYYFARLFDLLDHGRVITIDVNPQPDRPEHPRLTYLPAHPQIRG